MPEPLPTNYKEFLEFLKKNPEFAARIQREQALSEFKEKYGVKKSTPLKCPACRDMYGGTLWASADTPHKFVCKKCKLVFYIECLSMPISNLIEKIREINKGQGKSLLEEERSD